MTQPLTQLRVPLAPDMRMELYLISDGRVVVCQGYGFVTTYDQHPTGVTGVFDADGFSLRMLGDKEAQDYEYNVAYQYKQMPVLKEWLMQQNLQWPNNT